MISLKKKLLEIKDPTSDNYTAELKNIIFDKIYGKKEEMYYAILKKESNDLKLRFSAFYCLFTKYRRFEQKYQLFNLVETYIHLFSEDKYIYLVDIVYSQYYKFKALDINDTKCNLLEYLTQRDIQTKNSGVNVRYRGKHRFFKGFNEFIKEKTRRCDNDFEKIERHVFF